MKLIAYNECDIDSVYIGVTVLPTSLENNQEESSFVIYPNPSRGQFYISSHGISYDTVRIYTTTGELIFEKIDLLTHEFIDLQNAASGMYMVSVKEGQNKYWKRIVIVR